MINLTLVALGEELWFDQQSPRTVRIITLASEDGRRVRLTASDDEMQQVLALLRTTEEESLPQVDPAYEPTYDGEEERESPPAGSYDENGIAQG